MFIGSILFIVGLTSNGFWKVLSYIGSGVAVFGFLLIFLINFTTFNNQKISIDTDELVFPSEYLSMKQKRKDNERIKKLRINDIKLITNKDNQIFIIATDEVNVEIPITNYDYDDLQKLMNFLKNKKVEINKGVWKFFNDYN